MTSRYSPFRCHGGGAWERNSSRGSCGEPSITVLAMWSTLPFSHTGPPTNSAPHARRESEDRWRSRGRQSGSRIARDRRADRQLSLGDEVKPPNQPGDLEGDKVLAL